MISSELFIDIIISCFEWRRLSENCAHGEAMTAGLADRAAALEVAAPTSRPRILEGEETELTKCLFAELGKKSD